MGKSILTIIIMIVNNSIYNNNNNVINNNKDWVWIHAHSTKLGIQCITVTPAVKGAEAGEFLRLVIPSSGE